ncbi:MAG: 30S ribosomal protein S9 [Phycisphaerales bacterium]|nr:MAG: 30S ribosomal protein S9 [Phycisphaerales bacterium]
MSETENSNSTPTEPPAVPPVDEPAAPKDAAPVEGAAEPTPPAPEPPAAPPSPPTPAEPVSAEPTPPASPKPAAPPAPPAAPKPAGLEPPAPPAPEPVPAEKPAAPAEPAPTPAAIHRAPPDGHWWWGTGRRKRAVARVRIRPGTGRFIVNKRDMEEFFNEERDRNQLTAVLEKTNTKGALDVFVNVHGGGYTGQAGAIILGLGRAIRRYDQSLEPILRDNGFLTRDPRKVERKKYGQPGARKRFQFSKR